MAVLPETKKREIAGFTLLKRRIPSMDKKLMIKNARLTVDKCTGICLFGGFLTKD